jgi:hypothetical protein
VVEGKNGEGGIRTLGDVAATPVFETGPIGRSGTSPEELLSDGAVCSLRPIKSLVAKHARSKSEVPRMTDADFLRGGFVALEVNDAFSEAVLALRDGSLIVFRHRVGERTVQAISDDATLAAQVLSRIARFRLNARHLDVQFADGSRWETLFGSSATASGQDECSGHGLAVPEKKAAHRIADP